MAGWILRPRLWCGWTTDLPDSDLNLPTGCADDLHEVDPDGRILDLTDPELSNFPWIYIVEPGGLGFSNEEVVALRKYLLNGGFLMFDDFWGEAAWANVAEEMKKVFPIGRSVDFPRTSPVQLRLSNQVEGAGAECAVGRG
jgi:hypothetical protein